MDGRNGVRRHRVQILDRQGEKALGKPVGVYETMWIPPDCRPTPEAVQTLGDILSSLLALKPDTSVLVVGLGNRAMTPDAIGPGRLAACWLPGIYTGRCRAYLGICGR